MKTEIKFALAHKTLRQRFYKASQPLSKSGKGEDYRYTNSSGDNTMKLYADKEKKTTKEWQVPATFDGVVVSDAHTHTERLSFPMWEIEPVCSDNPYIFVCDNICGHMTFMTHGGDIDTVHPDKVYLRKLAAANGYKYGGIEQ